MNKMREKLLFWLSVLLFVIVIFAAVYLQWWRCGEMFPHAQLACFIGGGR